MQVESELSGLEGADKQDFLAALGVTDEDCGLKVRLAYCYMLLVTSVIAQVLTFLLALQNIGTGAHGL